MTLDKLVELKASEETTWLKAASFAMSDLSLGKLIGPVDLRVDFFMPRPKSHYRLSGTGPLKDGAPVYHVQKPDATKLLRSVEDALNDVVWKDDVQVSDIQVTKRWAPQPQHDDVKSVGCVVAITPSQAQERLQPQPIEKF